MDRSIEIFRKMFKRKIPNDQLQIHWTEIHISIIEHYFQYLSWTCGCDFQQLESELLHNTDWTEPWSSAPSAIIPLSLAQRLQRVFMAPRMEDRSDRPESPIPIRKKYQLMEAFLVFLVQLLYHKKDRDRVFDLEKELRFLATILGDTSLMMCADEHEEFQNLLSQVEAAANVAGIFVHSLFFPIDPPVGKMEERVGVVLSRIHLVKDSIMNFLNLQSSAISRVIYTTPRGSALDSLLIVDSLIYDLQELMDREDNPLADVKDHIKRLREGLLVLQTSIKDLGWPQPPEIGEMKEPLMRIGDMAHDAEYLVISFSVGEVPLWYLVNRLTDINHKIKVIATEIQEVTKKYKFGGLLKAPRYIATQRSLQARRHSEVDDVIVGFEDRAAYILEHLIGGATMHLQVISIFGMPGLGKTTFAKKLHNHPSVKQRFDKVSWCVVSQNYERWSVLSDILLHIASDKLGKDRILQMGEEALVEHIHKTLKGRRYLIIMDDIWDSGVLEEIQRCFPDDGNGSRILFTTRNKDVAPPNCILYELPFLSNDQCWELLEKKVFVNKPCPPQLLGIGKEIAANCAGLPLIVVVIAGILLTMDNIQSTWEEVRINLDSYILDGGDNSVMRILELSFKHLPLHLKPCFLYCEAFFGGGEIRAREMMRVWIAEGFIREEKEKNTENLAEEYLMELIDKSLVMVSERRSDGGVKTCFIHGLLRTLCLRKLTEENFVKFTDNYLLDNTGGSPLQSVIQCPVSWSFWHYTHHGDVICPYMLSIHGHDMRLLRVFAFKESSARLTGIEYLACLRFLVIKDLPPSIGNLVNLEYLRVDSDYIEREDQEVYLHSTIMKMKKLRYIRVPSGAKYGKDCNSTQTNNLESLSDIIIRNSKDEDMLKCSPHLRKLKCDYEKKVRGHFDLSFFAQLESMKLVFCKSRFIKEISLPSDIRKLSIGSDNKLSWKAMSVIGRLGNLEILKLRSIVFPEKRWDTRDGEFQKLKFLELKYISKLTQWNVSSSEHFPILQQLVLNCCDNLEEIPSEIGDIATLQLIEVQTGYFSKKSLEESAQRIQQEQLYMGNEELKLILPNRTGHE